MVDLCKIYPKHQQQTAKQTNYYNILISVNSFYAKTFVLRLGSFFNVHPKQILLFIVLIYTANRHIFEDTRIHQEFKMRGSASYMIFNLECNVHANYSVTARLL